MILFLMCVHLVMVLVVLIGFLRGSVQISPALIVTGLLLPIWGPLCIAAVQLHILGGEKADQEAESIRFGITDEVYRNIRMDKGGVEDILPIEDVLVSGSPRQRRSLLLSVLHSGPKDFVRPLRIAGVNDDTEVVHYAVTALVEIRSEYVQRISEMEKKLAKSPLNPRILLDYANLDEEYLNSGIPEISERDELISHCRNMLEKLLHVRSWEKRAGSFQKQVFNVTDLEELRFRSEIMKRIAKMCLLQGNIEAAEQITEELQKENPSDGESYLLRIHARALAKDGKGIAEVISEAYDRKVYFSPDQRSQLEFWSTSFVQI